MVLFQRRKVLFLRIESSAPPFESILAQTSCNKVFLYLSNHF